MRARLPAAWLLVAVMLAGCVSPTVGDAHYRAMAATSAERARSTVQAARLVAGHARDGRLTQPFVEVQLRQDEEHLAHVLSAFGTRQPPGADGDAVRTAVLDRVSRAHEVVTEMRIAAYRGELDRLVDIAAPLEQLAAELEDLRKRYSA